MPQFPEGSPFEDFFKEYFDQFENDNNKRPLVGLGSGFIIDEEFFDFLRTMQACRDTFGDTDMSMVIAPGEVCEKFFGELNSE